MSGAPPPRTFLSSSSPRFSPFPCSACDVIVRPVRAPAEARCGHPVCADCAARPKTCGVCLWALSKPLAPGERRREAAPVEIAGIALSDLDTTPLPPDSPRSALQRLNNQLEEQLGNANVCVARSEDFLTRLGAAGSDVAQRAAVDVSIIIDGLAAHRSLIVQSLRASVKRRIKALDAHSEEATLVLDQFESFARLCVPRCDDPELDYILYDSLRTALPSLHSLLTASLAARVTVDGFRVYGPTVQQAIAASSRVQYEVSPTATLVSGPGLSGFLTGEGSGPAYQNDITVTVRDASADVVTSIQPADVTLSISTGARANHRPEPSVRVITTSPEPGVVKLGYRLGDPSITHIWVYISVHGVTLTGCPWRVRAGTSLSGTFVRTLALPPGVHNRTGFAVDPEGVNVVVASEIDCSLAMYSLAEGTLVRTIGSEGTWRGRFRRPQGIAFAPNGNILVCEDINKRLQEVTSAGRHVKFMGAEECFATLDSVAASGDSVVAAERGYSTGKRIFLFRYDTGELIRAFGKHGNGDGELQSSCPGICFSPDNRQIIVADNGNKRLSIFTTEGVFVRHWSPPPGAEPTAVCVAGNGDILLSSTSSLYLLAHEASGDDISSIVEGTDGSEGGKFNRVTGVCMVGKHLYVLDRVMYQRGADRLHVFL